MDNTTNLYEQRPNGQEATCARCGVVIADWGRSGGQITRETPNRDRHTEWHRQIEQGQK